MTDRRTKRRYAHELYPDPDGSHTPGPLNRVVPHLYARALGLSVVGTMWSAQAPAVSAARSVDVVNARMIAALVDAISQGFMGQRAYDWAYAIASDETGEVVWDRAVEYGIDPYGIRPYPCGPEANYHYHYGPADHYGVRIGRSVHGRESECEACTEPVPVPQTPLPGLEP